MMNAEQLKKENKALKDELESTKSLLREAYVDVIWMAIRYAHGRHTYAPGMVRDSISRFQKVFPDWKPRPDHTLEKPVESELGGIATREDYLDDLVDES